MQLYAYRNTMNGARAIAAAKSIHLPKPKPTPAQLRILQLEAECQELQRRIEEGQEAVRKANMALAGERHRHSVADIQRRICRALGVSRQELLSNRRNGRVMLARQAAMYWAARLTKLSTPQLGRIFERDHTTCLHAKRSYVEKRRKMGRFLRDVR